MIKINKDAIRAVAAMTDSLAVLRRELQSADRATETAAPGSAEERYALQLGRMVKRLGDAIAATPTNLWLEMCKDRPADPDALDTADLKSVAA